MLQFPTVNNKQITSQLKRFSKSIWLFPAIATFLLLLLTGLKINGSSVGIYQGFFNGPQKDSHLLANQPQSVRSDEFLVVTQMTLAQTKENFPLVNPNVGNGENMSLQDVPYKEWSQLFKPHNWAFFVLPADYAFAFKWWVMAYLLVISCYFFVLAILPGRRLVAAAIAIGLLFSAFVQWWYQYITLGSLYYSLFLGTAFVQFLKQKTTRQKVIWSAIITYLIACFALELYPPFQIACGLAVAGFAIGELFTYYQKNGRKEVLKTLGWFAACFAIAGFIVGIFALTRSDVISKISETVYPGRRVVESGGFSLTHLLSGHLGTQFLHPQGVEAYRLFGQPTNASEASNFLLLTPFLFLPSMYVLYRSKKQKLKIDWALLGVNVVFIIFMLELFVHAFTPLSKLFLLDKVPLQRGLIGLGLLNILGIVLLIRNLTNKKLQIPKKLALAYTGLVFLVELGLSYYAHHQYPGFISHHKLLVLSIPVPLIVYDLLRGYYRGAAVVFAAFSLLIAAPVNPLYRGLSVIENNPLDAAIQQTTAKSPQSKWVSEGLLIESFPFMNGAPSLSGVYYYPQANIWKKIPTKDGANTYNRYAHVNFELQTDGDKNATSLELLGIDHFAVKTNVCSQFLTDNNVKYLLTTAVLQSPCIAKEKQVNMPGQTFYIYKRQ